MTLTITCPKCKSTDLIKSGWKWVRGNSTPNKIRKQQYLCNHCGRITINPILPQPRDNKGRFISLNETSTAT